MAGVFLSYDHEDGDLARPLIAALEKAGHSVWYDRQIHGGAQFSRKIEQALDEADAVVVLWTHRSLESAWVRDEAAEGRDRGKLVPLSVDDVTPPMGFRQYQTIALGAWKGRGKVPHLRDVLTGIENQVRQSRGQPELSARRPAGIAVRRPTGRWIAAAAGIALLLAAAVAGWTWIGGRGGLPVVGVAAADTSPRSKAAASDLFVKLGSLAQVGEGKWQLVDAASKQSRIHYLFRTADTGSAAQAAANLVLLDGDDQALLWSREFAFPQNREADLRQQLSLTAGRVLACALESRAAGGLSRDLLKLFLHGCALMAETATEQPQEVAATMRTVVAAEPEFAPAWARLLHAGGLALDITKSHDGDIDAAVAQLRSDMAMVERIAPELPELALAKVQMLPPTAFAKRMDVLADAGAKAPEHAEVLAYQAAELRRVGRMDDAVGFAQRAAKMDPLSPSLLTQMIMSLAYADRIDDARHELARAERLWVGTDALRQTLWAFHLRYGDPALARKYAPVQGDEGLELYFKMRADPSAESVRKLLARINEFRTKEVTPGQAGWAIQATAEIGRIEDAFYWVGRVPKDALAEGADIFFRPNLAPLRNDPRFMKIAADSGLADYWRTSGKWPDFCREPDLPYDCKAEAAKYA